MEIPSSLSPLGGMEDISLLRSSCWMRAIKNSICDLGPKIAFVRVIYAIRKWTKMYVPVYQYINMHTYNINS